MQTKYYALSSDGKTKYVVTLNHAGGAQWCTCVGYKFNHKCRHADAVEANPSAFEKVGDEDPKSMSKTVKEMLRKAAEHSKGKRPHKEFDKRFKNRMDTFLDTKQVVFKRTVHWTFVKPMLAKTATPKMAMRSGQYAVEVKYNGHRMLIRVRDGVVLAWARSGKSRTHSLPKHLIKVLLRLPDGLYDGELMAGQQGRSWNVTETEKEHERCFVVFDVLTADGEAQQHKTYDDRREVLERIFRKTFRKDPSPYVLLSESLNVDSWADVMKCCKEIWKADGEGVIIKRRDSLYLIGTRNDDWLKLKNLCSGVAKIVGFKAKKSGPVSIILGEDAKGNPVKVRNPTMALRKRIGRDPKSFHGVWFRFDYQERTPSGGYFHPRFDRFEKE